MLFEEDEVEERGGGGDLMVVAEEEEKRKKKVTGRVHTHTTHTEIVEEENKLPFAFG